MITMLLAGTVSTDPRHRAASRRQDAAGNRAMRVIACSASTKRARSRTASKGGRVARHSAVVLEAEGEGAELSVSSETRRSGCSFRESRGSTHLELRMHESRRVVARRERAVRRAGRRDVHDPHRRETSAHRTAGSPCRGRDDGRGRGRLAEELVQSAERLKVSAEGAAARRPSPRDERDQQSGETGERPHDVARQKDGRRVKARTAETAARTSSAASITSLPR